ncbi:MAG: response regulator [Planctomycetaceae bacterium]|nr:response regulator [Planctomycetaceae bacterium]
MTLNTQCGNSQRVRVLVADDDAVCLELLAGVVSDLDYDVETATDGYDAFDRICRGDFRIVLSDWQMPGLSGIELCRRVRQRQLSGYVYFMLVTSLKREENLVLGLEAGADDFIGKPIEPQELKVRLRVAQRIVSLESRDLLIFSLAKLAESRDPETGAHLERMREYSRVLAQDLSATPKYQGHIDADYVRTIFLTSPLHDIGKVGIPDNVLLKPGRLTSEEFAVMKQHAEIGSQILDAAARAQPGAEYLCFARDIAWSHHEKYNGSGYPRGLAGNDIPLCGRLVAVADVYDALTTKRVYKDAFSHEQARKIILDGSGEDFDPDVVEAFVRCEQVFIEVKRQLDDTIPGSVATTLIPELIASPSLQHL